MEGLLQRDGDVFAQFTLFAGDDALILLDLLTQSLGLFEQGGAPVFEQSDAGGVLAGLDELAYKEALRGRHALGLEGAAGADLDEGLLLSFEELVVRASSSRGHLEGAVKRWEAGSKRMAAYPSG
jgi:hypothetical protein